MKKTLEKTLDFFSFLKNSGKNSGIFQTRNSGNSGKNSGKKKVWSQQAVESLIRATY